MPEITLPEGMFTKSKGVIYLYNNGEFYIYHNYFGFLMACSRDIIDLVEEFRKPTSLLDVVNKYKGKYEEGQIEQFLDVLCKFSCIIPKGHKEEEEIWKCFVYPAKWTLSYVNDDHTLSFYCGKSDGDALEVTLSQLETAFVRSINGDKTVENIAQDIGWYSFAPKRKDQLKRTLIKTVKRLAHYDTQIIKLAKFPFSMFQRNERLLPPYLRSVVRFDIFDPHKGIKEEPWSYERVITPKKYYKEHITDAKYQFEDVETTLSHLFREPHSALAGESYGGRFAWVLWERGHLNPHVTRIMEVGGGLGFFAKSFLERFRSLLSDAKPEKKVSYTILDASPALMEAQRKNLEDLKQFADIRQIEGDAEEFDYCDQPYDLIISNEMIGDLSVLKLTKQEFLSQPSMIPELARFLRYKLPLEEPPDVFYLNIGAMRFIENAFKLLKPGGTCIIVEFGDLKTWPMLSSHLDHPEFSIRFDTLISVAETLGFETRFEEVTRFLRINPLFLTLVTTRPFFSALRYLLKKGGVELEKRAYTRYMLEDLLAGKIEIRRIEGLMFEPIEERCMGLRPRDFKVLTLVKPEM